MTRIEAARAALAAAKEAQVAAGNAVSAAMTDLALALRDDWIERARAARPLVPGEVEGWRTSTCVMYGAPPAIGYATVRGREVARKVGTKGAGIVVEVTYQTRQDDEAVRTREPFVREYAGNTRECGEWKKRFSEAEVSNG